MNAFLRLFFEFEITLHFRGGHMIRFRCSNMTTRRTLGNDLSEITVQRGRGFPNYVRLDDVVAITSRRVLR